jgi:transcriptional regulator with XRE-family HTH domain
MTFGTWLRAARNDHGCTRAELAKASGVPLGTLRDYEQDRRAPSLANAGRLAAAMGKSIACLASCIDLSAVSMLVRRGEPKYSLLTFGQHKGKLLDEVPTGYLQWLYDKEPRCLHPGQMAEIQDLLGIKRPAVEPVARVARRPAARSSRLAPAMDPIIERHLRERDLSRATCWN